MALRDLGTVGYLPMLSVRPAEMLALQELPQRDKDLMLPFFQLRPWVSAARLQNALDRLSEAYGERPFFISLAEPETAGSRRDVHDELDMLRSSEDGFLAWCQFVTERPLLMPSLQLTDVTQFDLQAQRMSALDRGMIVHVERPAFQFARQMAFRTAAQTDGGRDVIFVLDFGRQNKTFLLHQAEAVGYVRTILEVAPLARVALSASSFPDSFTAISSQAIYEREVFQGVEAELGTAVLYSDRGSARAERQVGGGGAPAPRIDYAGRGAWHFFRSDDPDRKRPLAYQDQALALKDEEIWDPKLRVWGTQMIERTALGDEGAIVSPARATAARINIHLHQQTFHDDPAGLYDTDDEWTD
ncbi:beta family protein [Brevundimonas sp.]|uniref:beta family protein n=1 Tax=Brevundimonas sp. TaxID=1871086 RepID=UPI0039194F44